MQESSVFIPLPPDFVSYLKSDGIILPRGCSLSAHSASVAEQSESDSEDAEEKASWSDTDSSNSSEDKPYFPAVAEKIESAIAELGGRVVPKLNWSAPRDASWLLPGNTLQCRTSGEVILLLKSSDFIAHDLTHVFEGCSDDSPTSIEYTLCLRKWEELQPSTEFRCFVRSHTLIGISLCSSGHTLLMVSYERPSVVLNSGVLITDGVLVDMHGPVVS
jgi:hypothetical protein